MTGWRFAYAMFIRSVNPTRAMTRKNHRITLTTILPYSRFAWLKDAKQFKSRVIERAVR